MSRAKVKPAKAVTRAWALYDPTDGYVFAPTCDWSRKMTERHTVIRSLRAIRVEIRPVVARRRRAKRKVSK